VRAGMQAESPEQVALTCLLLAEALVGVARDGANRWTGNRACARLVVWGSVSRVGACVAVCGASDNVWAFKSYMVKKKGIQGREFDKAMGLPEDFDYVDEQ